MLMVCFYMYKSKKLLRCIYIKYISFHSRLAGTCKSDLEPLSDKCDIIGDDCSVSYDDSDDDSNSDCICAYSVEGNVFCAKDIPPKKCDKLQKCEYTSDCKKPGSACVLCDTCGLTGYDYKTGVCFPPCRDNKVTTLYPTRFGSICIYIYISIICI